MRTTAGAHASSNLGRNVFGLTAVAFGLVTLIWHDYNDSDQLRRILNAASGPVFITATASAQIFGGAAIQFRRTAQAGATVLGITYLVFTVLCVPAIVATPRTYNTWGNFFEQFSLLTGAAIVSALLSSTLDRQMVARLSRILLGVCAASFGLEQAFYLAPTAHLVPKWLPPGQTFWAEATTAFFALSAAALFTNRMALPAARLLTIMLLIFGFLVWVPLLFADPHNHANWSETVETFAIAGAFWILADLLDDLPA